MKRSVLLLSFLTVLSLGATAQAVYDFGRMITGNPEDSKYLTEGYVTPVMKALGHASSNGWYNSAAPHKLGGFDITLTTSLAFAPALDKKYTVDNSKLTEVERVTDVLGTAVAPTGSAPTAFGSDPFPYYRSPKGTGGTTFEGPEGSGLNNMPVPGLGLGVGLPKGFELRVRFVPTFDFQKLPTEYTGNLAEFGVGVMHDIKQWIPGIKALPFDLSAFVGYNKVKLNIGIDKNDLTRQGSFTTTATTIQALVGKKLSILTVYGSVGYNIAKTDFVTKGSWDFNNDGDRSDAGEIDPVKLQSDSNGVRGTIGLRLRLAVIAFHADYSFQRYRTIAAGFGINFR